MVARGIENLDTSARFFCRPEGLHQNDTRMVEAGAYKRRQDALTVCAIGSTAMFFPLPKGRGSGYWVGWGFMISTSVGTGAAIGMTHGGAGNGELR